MDLFLPLPKMNGFGTLVLLVVGDPLVPNNYPAKISIPAKFPKFSYSASLFPSLSSRILNIVSHSETLTNTFTHFISHRGEMTAATLKAAAITAECIMSCSCV